MKDLYRRLNLNQPSDSPLLLQAAIADCKDPQTKQAAELILLDANRKRIYDNTYCVLKTIGQIRETLQLPASDRSGVAGEFEYRGPARHKSAKRPVAQQAPAAQKPRPRSQATPAQHCPAKATAVRPVPTTEVAKPSKGFKPNAADADLSPKKIGKLAGWVALVAIIVFGIVRYPSFTKQPLPETGVLEVNDQSPIRERTSGLKFFVPTRGCYYIKIHRSEDDTLVFAVMIRHGESLPMQPIVPGDYIIHMSVGLRDNWNQRKRSFVPPLSEVKSLGISVNDSIRILKEPS